MNELPAPTTKFDPLPVKPGSPGLRYTIVDHRGMRRPLASSSWSERARHAPGASRFLPKGSFSLSSIGMLVFVIVATFAMQDAGSRLATTALPGSSVAKTAIQLFGLFGPLVIFILLILAGLFFSVTKIWMPAVARHWLSIGQCASCRYDIASVEPEQDGCVVCPECGAAWKLLPKAES